MDGLRTLAAESDGGAGWGSRLQFAYRDTVKIKNAGR